MPRPCGSAELFGADVVSHDPALLQAWLEARQMSATYAMGLLLWRSPPQ